MPRKALDLGHQPLGSLPSGEPGTALSLAVPIPCADSVPAPWHLGGIPAVGPGPQRSPGTFPPPSLSTGPLGAPPPPQSPTGSGPRPSVALCYGSIYPTNDILATETRRNQAFSPSLHPLIAPWSAQPLSTGCVIFTSKSCLYGMLGIDWVFFSLDNARNISLHCHRDSPMTSTVILKAQGQSLLRQSHRPPLIPSIGPSGCFLISALINIDSMTHCRHKPGWDFFL